MTSDSGVVDVTLGPALLSTTHDIDNRHACTGGYGDGAMGIFYQMSQSVALNGRESCENGLNHVQDIVRRNLFDSNVIIKRKDMRHNT